MKPILNNWYLGDMQLMFCVSLFDTASLPSCEFNENEMPPLESHAILYSFFVSLPVERNDRTPQSEGITSISDHSTI